MRTEKSIYLIIRQMGTKQKVIVKGNQNSRNIHKQNTSEL